VAEVYLVLFIARAAFWLVLIGFLMPAPPARPVDTRTEVTSSFSSPGIMSWCLSHLDACLSGAGAVAKSKFRMSDAREPKHRFPSRTAGPRQRGSLLFRDGPRIAPRRASYRRRGSDA
jgi:hypothetical protein